MPTHRGHTTICTESGDQVCMSVAYIMVGFLLYERGSRMADDVRPGTLLF